MNIPCISETISIAYFFVIFRLILLLITEWCSDSSPSIDIGLLTSNFNEQGSFLLEVRGVKPYDCKFI